MLSMNISNLIMIYYGVKTSTLRPYKGTMKGTFKTGSIQQIKKGLFDKNYCFKVIITDKEIIDLTKLQDKDFITIGYQNKAEYMQEPFNQKNPSKLRIKYTFKIIEVNHKQLQQTIRGKPLC